MELKWWQPTKNWLLRRQTLFVCMSRQLLIFVGFLSFVCKSVYIVATFSVRQARVSLMCSRSLFDARWSLLNACHSSTSSSIRNNNDCRTNRSVGFYYISEIFWRTCSRQCPYQSFYFLARRSLFTTNDRRHEFSLILIVGCGAHKTDDYFRFYFDVFMHRSFHWPKERNAKIGNATDDWIPIGRTCAQREAIWTENWFVKLSVKIQ